MELNNAIDQNLRSKIWIFTCKAKDAKRQMENLEVIYGNVLMRKLVK